MPRVVIRHPERSAIGPLVGTLCSLNLFPDHKLTKEAKRGERGKNFGASEERTDVDGKRKEGRKERERECWLLASSEGEGGRQRWSADGRTDGPQWWQHERERLRGRDVVHSA